MTWPLSRLWHALPSFSLFDSSSPPDPMKAYLESRGGVADMMGSRLRPSPLGTEEPEKKVRALLERGVVDEFQVNVDGVSKIQGIVFYPHGCDRSDTDHAVLYHNPNGITFSQYIEEAHLTGTAAKITEVTKCPLILYDYRGGASFRASASTLLADGEAAIRYAFHHFDSITVMGSSLGGAVATIALDRHLEKRPDHIGSVKLISHDSFSHLSRLLMPNWPNAAEWIGWTLGGYLDAEGAMKNLIRKNIPITILTHTRDPIIPEGARMADAIYRSLQNVRFIESAEVGHANLSDDLCRGLFSPLD